MKRSMWVFLMLVLGLSLLFGLSGCEQTEFTADNLQVLSVSPALDATDVPSTEPLSITFNFSLKNAGITKENLFSHYLSFQSGVHTAGTPEVTKLEWSNQNRTMTLYVKGWSNLGQGSGNNRVAIRATNRLEDVFGNILGIEPVLWRFRLRYHGGSTTTTTTTSTSTTTTTTTTTTTIPLDPNLGETWVQGATAAFDGGGVFRNACVEHNGQLWSVGGNVENNSDRSTSEVWNSSDGHSWTLVTREASFGPIFNSALLSYNGKLWLIGGGENIGTTSVTNEVWNSTDGLTWTKVAQTAPFNKTMAMGAAVFNGEIWLIGGVAKNNGCGTNEVWHSSDGASWTMAGYAPFAGRFNHTVVIFNGGEGDKLYVIAGNAGQGGVTGITVPLNDVWSSADGYTWTEVTSTAAFCKRYAHSSAVLDHRIWVIGGGRSSWEIASGVTVEGDVWYSQDGAAWVMATAEAAFGKRFKHVSLPFQNKLWVMFGDGGLNNGLNDTWYSPAP